MSNSYTLKATIENAQGKVKNVEFYMQRTSHPTQWYLIHTGNSPSSVSEYKRKARTPGFWAIKAVVKLTNGSTIESNTINVEEQFPSIDRFYNNQTLRSHLSGTLWTATINYATQNQSRHAIKEHGCFIYMTSNGTYYAGPTIAGPEVILDGKGGYGTVNFNYSDVYYDPRTGPDLIVGTMHTHYPIKWAEGKFEQPVGASSDDQSTELPGIGYDYSKPTYTGHDLNLPKAFFKHGKTNRRPTTR